MFSWLRALGLALILSSAGGTAHAAWYKAESEHFIVYGEGLPTAVRGYAQKLEAFDALLRTFHKPAGQDGARKLEIYLVNGEQDFHRVFPGTQNVAGIYSASPRDVFAVAISRTGLRDDVMLHEYVHHFMLQYFPYNYPAWLVEGWAEYFETAEITEDRVDVGRMTEDLARQLMGVELPLETVLGSSVSKVKPEMRFVFYAQAWLLTHYMLSDPTRKAQLGDYMRAVGEGADPVKAMEQATGASIPELTKRVHLYLNKELSFTRIKGLGRDQAQVTLSKMPDSADDLLLENERLRDGVDKEDRQDVLERVRSRARKWSGDRLADLALARAEVLYGDRVAGEAVLGRYLAANPNDLDALRIMADGKLAAADAEKDEAKARDLRTEARKYLTKAFGLDQTHYQTLYAYAWSQRNDPSYRSENTLNILILAHQLAPQVQEITFHTAEALGVRGRYDEAIALLAPLANAPHGGDMAKAAGKLLEDIRKRQGTKS